MERPDLLVFYGRGGASEPERLVDGARRAATLQLLDDAAASDLFRHVVLATNHGALAAEAEDRAEVARTPDTIDFGRALGDLVERLGSAAVVYVGGGSAPLVGPGELREMVAAIETPGQVYANNLMSSDYVAFRPASALDRTAPIRNDNDLAWRLHHDAGLARVPVERTLAATLDIDTPTDLALLRLAPGVPPRLRAYLDEALSPPSSLSHAPDLPIARSLAAVEATMADPYKTLIVAGRLNTQLWALVERDVSFMKRLFVEERGMRANGRQERGEVRSLLALLLLEVGPMRFFEHLAALGEAMVFDTRPLFAHLVPHLSTADRFASDLLRPDLVADPLVRGFTAAARDTPLPVVLGGHALVTGGLWLLAQRVRAARDAAAALANQGATMATG